MNQNDVDKTQLQRLYRYIGLDTYINGPPTNIPVLDIEYVLTNITDANKFELPIQKTTAFGSIYDQIIKSDNNFFVKANQYLSSDDYFSSV